MKAFLFGLGLGVALGMLFAPMSGEDARDNLSERANDLASSAKETANDWASTAKETIDQGRERIRSGVGAVRNMVG